MIEEHVPVDWISAGCPLYVARDLVRVRVRYLNMSGVARDGQLVVNKAVAEEIDALLERLFEESFPIGCILPAHVFDFHDAVLTAHNVTHGFCFRYVYGKERVSWHGFGLALDINPRVNPMKRRGRWHPPNTEYCPGHPGVLHADHPVVHAFKERGWEWGGDWDEPFTPHHFHKPLELYPD